ncbi:MAG TPA: bifunctional helix-turn-helix transcriptional regulator/GNAT family N-acetyltransferase [Chitinophaga sp.]|uniref:bifunctional helix-turn-helix transcriptional regulator/GNAT family N-acetyltransferase n=1 Tax=Chitinophaga sp. TaxID=1869181 RepID=UPI002DBF4A2C|nr:bifunctional helix-turn-helix transcriptional regulator/GNAT family N-acetyltransferase [Chitinophaga sp.]HEU4552301.1 bifunctional helix-turn-helix transcriptional regulator/GNAT family N-acetyltransferase [Chitinophaga sp.]
MDFYDEIGKMALGSRLRRLSDLLTEEASQIYALYNIEMQPKWFPVFYVLSRGEERTITEIAKEIGHTHPSVSQIVREMAKKGYVKEKKGKKDGRKNYITLSSAGQAIHAKIQDQYKDVGAAVENAMKTTQYDLWKGIAEWEFLLEQKSLLRRVQEEKKQRESAAVQIVDYQPEHAAAFRQLNEEWITTYFKMEAADYKALDHPKEYILDKGGHILMAIYEGQPVGTCALIKMDNDTYELAKMAVSPEARGKNIGWLLGQACIELARRTGATRLYLESNTILKPAISLYHKLGFKKITGPPSPYERANIQMEFILD